MSAPGWLQLGLELAGAVLRFTRKRGRNQEDHYFPAHPEQLELRPGVCFHCRRWYARPLPKRGCPGQPVDATELA